MAFTNLQNYFSHDIQKHFYVTLPEAYELYHNTIGLWLDADKARKHGLDEFVMADPCKFDHHDLLIELQSLTLDYRLNDPHSMVVSHVSHPHSMVVSHVSHLLSMVVSHVSYLYDWDGR